MGGRVGEVAERLGFELMPWQRAVADVALEVDSDTGRLAYSEINLSVPRQSGKTALLLTIMVHRALRFGGPQNIVYTAQSRNAARRKWEDEHVAALERSVFAKRGSFTVRRSNGSEAILWANGSRHGVDAPTETAGHGDTLDLAVIDEAFAHVDDRVEQAMAPARITRPSSQLWVVSTAGNGRSAYLYRKVLAGRANIDKPGPTAYFEWSAADEDDPTDPEVWRRVMPALGHTITEDAIRAELDRAQRRGELDLFLRAYLNRWVEVPVLDEEAEKVIPLEWFDDCIDKRSKVEEHRVFAVDVAPDRTTAAVVVVGKSCRGGTHVEVVEHRPGAGTEWVVPRLVELAEKWPTKAVAAHLAGPVGSLEPALQGAFGDLLRPVTDRELTAACGGIYDGIRDRTLVHVGEPALRAALDGGRESRSGRCVAVVAQIECGRHLPVDGRDGWVVRFRGGRGSGAADGAVGGVAVNGRSGMFVPQGMLVVPTKYAPLLAYLLRDAPRTIRQATGELAPADFTAWLDDLRLLAGTVPQVSERAEPTVWLSTREAARRLGLSERRVRDLAKNAVVRSRRRGERAWELSETDVDDYAAISGSIGTVSAAANSPRCDAA